MLALALNILSQTLHANSDTSRNGVNTLAPDVFVDGGVNANIFSAPSSLSELADHSDAARSSSLVAATQN